VPCPVVLTLHDVVYARRPEWYPGRLDPVRRWFLRSSAQGADRIVTDSAFSRDEIVAAYGIPPERISVVPLAAGRSFSPEPGCARHLTVLHVGDLHTRRNLPMLLDVVLGLRAQVPSLASLTLRLIGVDHGVGPALRAEAARAGAPDAVLLEGPVNEAALVDAYRSAAVFAYPSQYEGFGLPVLEAMACATPVVASRAASIPDVAGDAAVLVPPTDQKAWFDALRSVLETPALRASLAERGVQRAAEFTWARSAEATMRVYRSLSA
jgi:glycosyltransferase involved in cell wall biosynthesis